MRNARLDVSSLFNPHSDQGEPPAGALQVVIKTPELGAAWIEDLGDELRLWLSIGGTMTVPRESVKVIERHETTLLVEWRGELLQMSFTGRIQAFRAERVLTEQNEEEAAAVG